MVISKLDAAKIQLDSAIEHFFKSEHVLAVTLAGAAEEVLGGLLNASGQKSSFEFMHNYYQNASGEKISLNNFSRDMVHQARNWLKHANHDAATQFDITEKDSIMMLMRAVSSYTKLTGDYNTGIQITKFAQYYSNNRNQIQQMFS